MSIIVQHVSIPPTHPSDSLPLLSTDLVRELNTTYPPRCATPGQTLESIWRDAGKRELIDALMSKVEFMERVEGL